MQESAPRGPYLTLQALLAWFLLHPKISKLLLTALPAQPCFCTMASLLTRAAVGAARHSSLFAVGATVAATGAGAVGYASCETTTTTTTVTTTTTTSGGAAPAAPGVKMMKQRGDKVPWWDGAGGC